MGLQRVGHDWVTELNWTEGPALPSKPTLTGSCQKAPIPSLMVSSSGWHQYTFKVAPILETQAHTPVYPQQSWLGLAASHSRSQPWPPVCPQQSQHGLVHSQPGTSPTHQGIHSCSGQVLQWLAWYQHSQPAYPRPYHNRRLHTAHARDTPKALRFGN